MGFPRVLLWCEPGPGERVREVLLREWPGAEVVRHGLSARPGREFSPGSFDLVVVCAGEDCAAAYERLRELADARPGLPGVVLCPKAFTPECVRTRLREEGRESLIRAVCAAHLGETVKRALEGTDAEEELRAAERRYRDLFENLPIGMYQRLPDGTFLDVNAALVEMLGFPDRETLLRTRVRDLYVDPEEQARFQRLLEERGVVRDYRVQVRRYDGTPIWQLISARAVRDPDGRLLYYEGAIRDITDMVRAEEALRQSEERFRRLADAAMEAIVIHTADRILECNRAACEMFGYSRDELLGLRPEDLVAPEDRQLVLRKVEQGVPGPYEARGLRKDGSTFWAVVRGHPMPYGGTMARVAVIRDITDRKRIEEAARARADRLARQQEALAALARLPGQTLEAPEAPLDRIAAEAAMALGVRWVSVWKAEPGSSRFACVGLNEPARRPYGKGSRVDLTRSPVYERALREGLVVAAADVRSDPRTADLWEAYWEPLGIRASIDVPIRVEGDLAGVVCFEHTGAPRAWETDEVTFAHRITDLVAHAMLASDKARLEAEARSGERRILQLMDAVAEGLVLVDTEGRVLAANRSARVLLERLTGTARPGRIAALGGRPLMELLGPPPEGQAAHEIRFGSPRRVVEVRARPVELGPDRPGWAVTLRDVTAERQIGEQASLQGRLAAVGQLAAGIAHDFNNLLLAITGYAELVKGERGLSEVAQQRLSELVVLGFRAADLVRQVLDFSRGSGTGPREPVNLVSLVKETVRMLERTLPDHIRVRLSCQADEILVRGAPAELQEVLLNLAVNARDAMPGGGVIEIAVGIVDAGELPPSLASQAGTDRWAELRVTDTGCGIPPENLERIFEPFFTTKSPDRGTGLGLAQVFGLVRQHGGHVTVESEVGRGSTFRVFLPVHRGRRRPDEVGGESLPLGTGQTVLVVDDDPLVREITASLLETLGYRVLRAEDGRQALETVLRAPGEIDLVLSDVSMPELDGLGLVHALREHGVETPVVLMSGYTPPHGLPPRVLFVPKPAGRSTLARAVARALRGEENVPE